MQIKVNGPDAHPIYKFLKNFSQDSTEIGWNFVKFLVVNGYPVKRYAPRVNPKKIEADLVQYLDQVVDSDLDL
jgi:glutathione peroxidase-family protein